MTGNWEELLETESMRLSNKLYVIGEVEGGFSYEAQISGLGTGYKKYSILDWLNLRCLWDVQLDKSIRIFYIRV